MNKFNVLYHALCIAGALGMTLFCFKKFLKNESVVSASYKLFHETPDDVYPSISICFQNRKIGPFEDTNDIKKTDISNMMKGITEFNQSLLGNLTYEDMTIKLQIKKVFYRMLSGITERVLCANSECFKTYGDGMIKCFTYDMIYKKNKRYQTMTFLFKNIWTWTLYQIKIFLHHPGQLFRNGLHPILKGSSIQQGNQIYFNIQSVTALKRRKEGNTGCNAASSTDDESKFWNEVELFNCTAKYPG